MKGKLVEITLSPEEIRIVRWLATQRNASARQAGVKDAQVGADDSVEIDINGMGGELAFCKMFNYYPDMSVGPRSGGWDCKDSLRLTYDIKTTKHQNGSLLATLKKKDEPIDFYVLMIGDLPTYKLIGVVHKDDLFEEKNIKDLGHGKGYCLNQTRVKHLTEGMYLGAI